MMTVEPKGLTEILEEDVTLKEKYTYQEYLDNKIIPRNSDTSLEDAYESYLKIKLGKEY